MTVLMCLVSNRQKWGSLEPCYFHNPCGFFFCSFRSLLYMQYLNTWGAKRRETGDLCAPYDKKLISLHHLSRSQQVFKALHAFGCYASTYLVALRPS